MTSSEGWTAKRTYASLSFGYDDADLYRTCSFKLADLRLRPLCGTRIDRNKLTTSVRNQYFEMAVGSHIPFNGEIADGVAVVYRQSDILIDSDDNRE